MELLKLILSLSLLYLAEAAPATLQQADVASFHESIGSVWNPFRFPGVSSVVAKLLGIDGEPTDLEVMTVPTYANWTNAGWSIRVHGAAYRHIPFSKGKLDSIAELFTPGLPRSTWTDDMRSRARNMTLSLLSLPQKDLILPFTLKYSDGSLTTFNTRKPTDSRGEFESYINVQNPLLSNGVDSALIQTLELHTNLSEIGNATAYFVPEKGITVISDIDDILRDTKIFLPRTALATSFAYKHTPWDQMPSVLSQWHQEDPSVHFHYVTTTPRPIGRTYMDFIFNNYPLGSFDFRPFNFTTIDQIFHVRKINLRRVFETYPKRKFIILGDTSNTDALVSYPEMATTFPNQISCILMRNVSATEPLMKFAYDTSGFKNVDNSTYMFFRTADDLRGINFLNGGCRNLTFAQNVTFSKQEVPSLSDIRDVLLYDGNWKSPFASLKTFLKAITGVFGIDSPSGQ